MINNLHLLFIDRVTDFLNRTQRHFPASLNGSLLSVTPKVYKLGQMGKCTRCRFEGLQPEGSALFAYLPSVLLASLG